MKAPLSRLAQQARPHILAVALVCAATIAAAGVAWAQTRSGVQHQGSVIGDDVLYSIGGGRAVSMGGAANMHSIGVGVGWNSNLICGDMSITTTLQNQLNGITNGFQAIMSSVIQNATAAVASLPALIIQRADPGLYNLLTNGVLQARLDFDRSKLTCRAIANRMADMAGGQLGWDQLAEGMALKQSVASTDAVSAIDEAEANRGNNGVPWVGGDNAGGAGQPPVRVVGDVTRAGYNLINGRSVTDTSSIAPSSCSGNLACQTWSSPDAAAAWAVRVLGEQEQRTCDACTKTVTTPGVGLTPLIQEEYESKLEVLQELVAGSRPTGFDNLQAAGSASLPITRGVIEALRDEPDQDLLARRLASEVALASVLEKALLLQRTLLTGRKEPNVAANELAQKA
ncbi:MAG: integrating conjugative element protein, partial [Burkholderiaceae bacterium]|nr:integrating conjugative element protein [Burkholderiaceae bacterium]